MTVSYEVINETLSRLTSKKDASDGTSVKFRELLEKIGEKQKALELIESEIADIIDEYEGSFTFETEIIEGDCQRDVIYVQHTYSSWEFLVSIVEFKGLFFTNDHEYDPGFGIQGPYTSIEKAIENLPDLFSERSGGKVEIFFTDDIPRRFLWKIRDAVIECDEIIVNGREVFLNDPFASDEDRDR